MSPKVSMPDYLSREFISQITGGASPVHHSPNWKYREPGEMATYRITDDDRLISAQATVDKDGEGRVSIDVPDMVGLEELVDMIRARAETPEDRRKVIIRR